MQPVTFAEVLLARQRIRPHLARTPLHSYPALNAFLGAQVYIKHENYQPVGASKVLGLICSGGNTSLAHLERALSESRASQQ